MKYRKNRKKIQLKREENEGIVNKELSVEDLDTENETYEVLIELNKHQGQQLRKLIERKANETGIKLEPTHSTKHKIDVQGHEPIKQRYYYVLPKVREYMYEEVDKILEESVIEPSNSDWSNPVVMMKKPNGKYGLCLD